MNIVTANMMTNGSATVIARQDTGPIRAALMTAPGIPRVLPAATVQAYPHPLLLQLMVEEGLYVWPTLELAQWLHQRGVEMEIGAGNGALAEYMCIRATDNYSQAPDYRCPPKLAGKQWIWQQGQDAMRAAGQAFVTYGLHVERIEAMEAVIRYKPAVIVGLFITHQFKTGDQDGNQFGPDEEKLIRRATYIMVGNAHTHRNKRILPLANETHEFPWLITRGTDQALNRIWVWNKTR